MALADSATDFIAPSERRTQPYFSAHSTTVSANKSGMKTILQHIGARAAGTSTIHESDNSSCLESVYVPRHLCECSRDNAESDRKKSCLFMDFLLVTLSLQRCQKKNLRTRRVIWLRLILKMFYEAKFPVAALRSFSCVHLFFTVVAFFLLCSAAFFYILLVGNRSGRMMIESERVGRIGSGEDD